VKQEPTSPEIATRHRPRRLDLTDHNKVPNGALSGRPLTSKESAGLVMQDVGLACLSPGFNTKDPAMQQQLQRSMSVRDQQRLIIEARQKGQKQPNESDTPKNGADALFRPNKMPGSSRRKGPPPALSIAPPSHAQFANERVIQSAPLGASFTGLRQHPDAPETRQVVNRPSNLSHTSHIHHVPAMQTANRLPPITDVFPGELQSNGQVRNGPSNYTLSPGHSSNSNNQPPLPSPGYPAQFQQQHKQQAQQQQAQRPREFQSAEEAVRQLTGGRDDLLPRIVHYGGHQPPTPPSPVNKTVGLSVSEQHSRHSFSGSSGARRRDRDEYEQDAGSPPLGRQAPRMGPFSSGRDSPQTQAQKKEQFMKLMEQAWDLFHS
jgi:hypothetical protein